MLPTFTKLIYAIVATATAITLAGSATAGENVSNPHTIAIRNSTHLLNYLTGMDPSLVALGLDHIAARRLQRVAPTYPIWIMDITSGTILYYEGQPAFKHQAVDKLVDEAGQRFGSKTAQKAKSSRAMWQRVTLGGVSHEMYCGQDYPFAVCTLIPAAAK